MDKVKDDYRQWMIGQLQLWEGEIARIRAEVQHLEPDSRFEATRRLQELDRYHRIVFSRYGDLLLAPEDQWDEFQAALDAATDKFLMHLEEFSLQPA